MVTVADINARVTFETVFTPNYWIGLRVPSQITNIMLHSTRSTIPGRSSRQEYNSTKSWLSALVSTASVDAVVKGDAVCQFLCNGGPRYNGQKFNAHDSLLLRKWHVGIGLRGVARNTLSIEIPQNLSTTLYMMADIEVAAYVCAQWAIDFPIPLVYSGPSADYRNSQPAGFSFHEWANTEKSDPGGLFPKGLFMSLVKGFHAEMTGVVTDPDVLLAVADHELRLDKIEEYLASWSGTT